MAFRPSSFVSRAYCVVDKYPNFVGVKVFPRALPLAKLHSQVIRKIFQHVLSYKVFRAEPTLIRDFTGNDSGDSLALDDLSSSQVAVELVCCRPPVEVDSLGDESVWSKSLGYWFV